MKKDRAAAPAERGMMHRARIYPVFLPHAGCPFQCIYCNQRLVTSSCSAGDSRTADLSSPTGFRSVCDADHQSIANVLIPHFRSVATQLVEDVRRTSMPGEIAFYGGTFTALPMNVLKVLLDEASRYVEEGIFTGVRFSTRPDGITRDICDFLSNYPVRTIELGVQSFSDDVLSESGRGYSARTVRDAAGLVHERGWKLGIQLMPGLPGDTITLFMESVRSAIALQPALVRLYPTVVLAQTPLAKWYYRGKYRPLTLEEALEWCALAYDALFDASIPVARMGLHADPELEKPGRILAGPYHPAFGYLVRMRWWRNRVDECLKAALSPLPGKGLIIRVPQRFVSEAIGARQGNLTYWQSKWRRERVRVQGVEGWSGGELECCWE